MKSIFFSLAQDAESFGLASDDFWTFDYLYIVSLLTSSILIFYNAFVLLIFLIQLGGNSLLTLQSSGKILLSLGQDLD